MTVLDLVILIGITGEVIVQIIKAIDRMIDA